MKQQGEKIAAVTVYDTPSARLADLAGIDCVLVGDSAVMTRFGRPSTVSATMDEMLLLTRVEVAKEVPLSFRDLAALDASARQAHTGDRS